MPPNPILEKLTEGESPVIRKWLGGKYKCNSLERFIKEYQIIADNLTASFIRDYLICERTGKPYAESTIHDAINDHRV